MPTVSSNFELGTGFQPSPDEVKKYRNYKGAIYRRIPRNPRRVRLEVIDGRVYRTVGLIYRIPSVKMFGFHPYSNANEEDIAAGSSYSFRCPLGYWAEFSSSCWMRDRSPAGGAIAWSLELSRTVDESAIDEQLEAVVDLAVDHELRLMMSGNGK